MTSTKHIMPWAPRAHFPLRSGWIAPSGRSCAVVSLNELNDTVTFRYLRSGARQIEGRSKTEEVVLDAAYAMRVMKALK